MKLVGREVPMLSGESFNWIYLTIPSSKSTVASASDTTSGYSAPLTEDCASCYVSIGDNCSRTYLFWRINKSLPHVLELLEFSVDRGFSHNGLRIVFPDNLSPFAFIYHNSCDRAVFPHLLYTLTVFGVVYQLKLRNVDAYASSSTIPENQFVQLDVRASLGQGIITRAAILAECYIVGTNLGSVIVFRLGSRPGPNSPDSQRELRDDTGIGRLLGFRSSVVGAVQDLVTAGMEWSYYAFVLHSDGTFKVWDIMNHNRRLSHKLRTPSFTGSFKRLWVGQYSYEIGGIPVAVLYKPYLEDSKETVSVYVIRYFIGGLIWSMGQPLQNIPLGGKCVDIGFSSSEILILQNNGLVSQGIFQTSAHIEEAQYYALQEEFVADQLFQSSEHSLEDLLWITKSILSNVKEKTIPFFSSIFLRKLLQPGIFNDGVFRMTLLDYDRHMSDFELQSLTLGGLKKEILSVIEQEVNQTPFSALYCWRVFFNCYFDHWCKENIPLRLFYGHSTGAIILIRKSSVALFRSFDKIELLVAGFDEVSKINNLVLSSYNDELDRKILHEVFGCVHHISLQVGRVASSVIYELIVGMPMTIYDDVLPCILKILKPDYSSSVGELNISNAQLDSIQLSLHYMSRKPGGWGRLLEVIETYISLLIPDITKQIFDVEKSLGMNKVILVNSSSQIGWVMFEYASNILFFLGYLLQVSWQIEMSHDDVYKVQYELVPMLQKIIFEWLIIHFISSVPSEDFSYQLPQKIDSSSTSNRSCQDGPGKCNFTLALALLLDGPRCIGYYCELPFGYLPGPKHILCALRNFISWIQGRAREKSCGSNRHVTEMLIRNGHYNVAEVLIRQSPTWKDYRTRSVLSHRCEHCALYTRAHGTPKDAIAMPDTPWRSPHSHSSEVNPADCLKEKFS